jgi:hypothetical protein
VPSLEWKDGQRVFGGTHVDGLVLNQASTKVEKTYLGTPPPGQAPGSFFTQLAFAETTATGPQRTHVGGAE